MHLIAGFISVAIIVSFLWEAFETVILPRRIQRKLRFTRIFYISTWFPWRHITRSLANDRYRESLFSVFGPLSLVLLFASWGAVLVFAFGLLHWSLASGLKDATGAPVTFGTDLYMSGTTLFTLGLGDITPRTTAARVTAIVESAIGFGLIALVVSYLPTLYQAFARREANISLLAARAGSPPTAAEFLKRFHGRSSVAYLEHCEQWASELLESHVSYPALCYFRSQHAKQSWLGSMTVILDVCAVAKTNGDAEQKWQADLTFAMSRHALLDLVKVFHLEDREGAPDRAFDRFRQTCSLDPSTLHAIDELRQSYEPVANALAQFLYLDLPPWIADDSVNKA